MVLSKNCNQVIVDDGFSHHEEEIVVVEHHPGHTVVVEHHPQHEFVAEHKF